MEPKLISQPDKARDEYAENLERMTPAIHGLALTFQRLAFPNTFISSDDLPLPLYLRQAISVRDSYEAAANDLLYWIGEVVT